MKKILIIEDNKYEQIALDKIIHKIDEKAKTFMADNAGEAFTVSMDNDIDMFIVDIVLRPEVEGDVSGMDFVDMIRRVPKYEFVPVVFTTCLEDPQMFAYKDLHCYSYIRKPIHYKEAEHILRQAMKYRNGNCDEEKIYLKQDKIIYSIKKNDIIYVESHGGKMIVKTIKEEIVLFYSSCVKILNLLKSNRFVKCSRSTVVNQDYIKGIDIKNNSLILIDNFGSIPIGKTMRDKLMGDIKNELMI